MWSRDICPHQCNGDSLVRSVGLVRYDVVQLVRHSPRAGDVRHSSRSVQLAVQDVVHHAASVADLEAAGGDATHRGRPNDRYFLLFCQLDQFPGQVLRNSFGDDRYGADLGKFETLDGAVIG